jgi:HPt (histidine-containing phosphotransfer) domain-containing protein
VLSKLVDIFLRTSPEIINEMRRAVVDGEWSTACRLAHSLKSSGATLGAVSLTGACAELETCLDSAPQVVAKDVARQFEHLEAVYQATRAELDRVRGVSMESAA